MPRFSTDLDRGEQLAGSIVALAERSGASAVDSIFEAVRACSAGDTPAAAEHTRRLAVDAGVATGEIGWLATELDAATKDMIASLVLDRAARGAAVVLATHDPAIAARCHRQLRLVDGRAAGRT